MGSPPRMRGKVLRPPSTFAPVGITPAYAGKRLYCSFALATLWDHPRICGEKFLPPGGVRDVLGSPPHMRGKDIYESNKAVATRITPAYAGKSKFKHFRMSPNWDHPRICGEKPNAVTCLLAAMGSPPHMRGKDTAWNGSGIVTRITPAYAGKRPLVFVKVFRKQDHPRICGEKLNKARSCSAQGGSPPHMRGKD